MTNSDLVLFVAAMALATQVSRLLPLAFSKVPISPEFERWLGHVPIAILSALVIPEFLHAKEGRFELNTLFLAAGVVCIVAGARTKNLLLTTAVGIVIVALVRLALASGYL